MEKRATPILGSPVPSLGLRSTEVDKCTHINKTHYLHEQYIEFSAAEKHKVYQNQMKLSPGERPPCSKKACGVASTETDKIMKDIERQEVGTSYCFH